VACSRESLLGGPPNCQRAASTQNFGSAYPGGSTSPNRQGVGSLPGLTILTGSPGIAARILTTLARFVDRGVLPNRPFALTHLRVYGDADPAQAFLAPMADHNTATTASKASRQYGNLSPFGSELAALSGVLKGLPGTGLYLICQKDETAPMGISPA